MPMLIAFQIRLSTSAVHSSILGAIEQANKEGNENKLIHKNINRQKPIYGLFRNDELIQNYIHNKITDD